LKLLKSTPEHPIAALEAKALGDFLYNVALNAQRQGGVSNPTFIRNDGATGFVKRYMNELDDAISKWGMQLNTCMHVVANRI
jgi:hypothetical protein